MKQVTLKQYVMAARKTIMHPRSYILLQMSLNVAAKLLDDTHCNKLHILKYLIVEFFIYDK